MPMTLTSMLLYIDLKQWQKVKLSHRRSSLHVFNKTITMEITLHIHVSLNLKTFSQDGGKTNHFMCSDITNILVNLIISSCLPIIVCDFYRWWNKCYYSANGYFYLCSKLVIYLDLSACNTNMSSVCICKLRGWHLLLKV